MWFIYFIFSMRSLYLSIFCPCYISLNIKPRLLLQYREMRSFLKLSKWFRVNFFNRSKRPNCAKGPRDEEKDDYPSTNRKILSEHSLSTKEKYNRRLKKWEWMWETGGHTECEKCSPCSWQRIVNKYSRNAVVFSGCNLILVKRQ